MTIDLAFSFDTTGSMAPCIGQVRRKVSRLAGTLFDEIPDIRIAILAHGDYIDKEQILTAMDFSTNKRAICEFVNDVDSTYGGDADEAYEFVLHAARSLSWTSGTNKALVMIADCLPHKVGETTRDGFKCNLDWRNEAGLLIESGISIYPVQALGRRHCNSFYEELARMSHTPHLKLEQFSEINDLILAISHARAGSLERFEKKLETRGGVSFNILRTVDVLSGRKERARRTSTAAKRVTSKRKSKAADFSRFQVLEVDHDCDIKGFVQANGLIFKIGRGFYEFTKRVTIQDYKEVIAQDPVTNEVFEGETARELLGIPVGETAKVKPEPGCRFKGFVQSTSVNRKLLAGTQFLYEVDYSR